MFPFGGRVSKTVLVSQRSFYQAKETTLCKYGYWVIQGAWEKKACIKGNQDVHKRLRFFGIRSLLWSESLIRKPGGKTGPKQIPFAF